MFDLLLSSFCVEVQRGVAMLLDDPDVLEPFLVQIVLCNFSNPSVPSCETKGEVRKMKSENINEKYARMEGRHLSRTFFLLF